MMLIRLLLSSPNLTLISGFLAGIIHQEVP
jgi:hypothetical protein